MSSTFTPMQATLASLSPSQGLVLDGVTKQYGDKTVLREITFEVRPGELVTLLGPSGCGKSTALKIIGGFEPPSVGRVLLDGADVTSTPARRRGTGIVFQQYSLFPHLTAAQNVEFGMKVQRTAKPQRRTRVAELIELVGLGEHRNKYPHQLSGGQQQRVALARALAVEPKILLLDEPLSALDALVRERLREEIVRIHRERGTTTVMVTHDQEEALAMADRVAVMNEGRIVQFDTPHNLYRTPEADFVAGFIGAMNRLTPEQITDTSVRVLGTVMPLAHAALDLRGDVLIRPENLTLTSAHEGNGIVSDVTLRGGVTSITVRIHGAVQGSRENTRNSGVQDSVRVDVLTAHAETFCPGDRVMVTPLLSDPSLTHHITTPHPNGVLI